MKVCLHCKVLKPLEDFGNYARYKDGKHRYCRLCWNSMINANRHARGAKPMLPFLERLWGSIEQCQHEEETCIFCCWPWQKHCDKDGYGRIAVSNQAQQTLIHVTRVVYEVWHAVQLPAWLSVCHYCDNPPCCNPLHLWLGTWNDNRQDCVKKGRQAKGLATGYYTMPEAFPESMRRLTEQDVRDIRTRYEQGNISQDRLAREYEVSQGHINSIIHRKSRKYIV